MVCPGICVHLTQFERPALTFNHWGALHLHLLGVPLACSVPWSVPYGTTFINPKGVLRGWEQLVLDELIDTNSFRVSLLLLRFHIILNGGETFPASRVNPEFSDSTTFGVLVNLGKSGNIVLHRCANLTPTPGSMFLVLWTETHIAR